MQEKKMLPIGIEDFKTVITQCYYVDKTKLISNILRNPDGSVFLFTRPRRFGKSLALSSLDYFFSQAHKNDSFLFKGLEIEKNESFSKEQGSYPLVHLNLKAIYPTNFDDLVNSISFVISDLYGRYPELENSKKLSKSEREEYLSFIKGEKDSIKLSFSLYKLVQFLYKHYEKKIIVLIDEYDSPILRLEGNKRFSEVLAFFRSFYGMVLKGNESIKYAAVTGVLQIAKESLFSDLNNLNVDNVLYGNYSEFFGFNEEETFSLLKCYGYDNFYNEVKDWYDGYIFGNTKTFNPWSVLKFVESKGKFNTYWISTGENSIFKKILFSSSEEKSEEFLKNLFFNGGVYEEVDTSLTFSKNNNVTSIASYLLATGYITTNHLSEDGRYFLTIPNKEVTTSFRKEMLNKYVSFDQNDWTKELREAFLSGKETTIKKCIESYVTSAFSHYDFGIEKNYQSLVLGMSAVLLFDYNVKSEVNAGKGRCDILITPKSKKGNAIIIELKCLKNITSSSNMKISANAAIQQIKKNDYMNVLKDNGISEAILYGISFHKNKAEIVSEKVSL